MAWATAGVEAGGRSSTSTPAAWKLDMRSEISWSRSCSMVSYSAPVFRPPDPPATSRFNASLHATQCVSNAHVQHGKSAAATTHVRCASGTGHPPDRRPARRRNNSCVRRNGATSTGTTDATCGSSSLEARCTALIMHGCAGVTPEHHATTHRHKQRVTDAQE